MNFRLVFKQLGILILLVGVCMSTSLVWAFLDWKEKGSGRILWAFFLSIAVCGLTGALLVVFNLKKTRKEKMYRKEAIAVVVLGWFLCGIFGSLPYIFSGVLSSLYHNFFDLCGAAVFESVSGFTTTGASIFPAPGDLPKAILFWRSLTNWLGGMGIVVLFVAILGETGAGAKHMVISEVPGPAEEPLKPRIRSVALLLWKIYIAISAAEVTCLLLQGMNLFESLCHTFATMATGGFSTLNGSIGEYNNIGFEITIIIFMILAGTSFNLYAILLTGRWRKVIGNREFQVYLLILFSAVALLTMDLVLNRTAEYGVGKALRDSSFQAASIMTTTGFCTADFNTWPNLSRWLLFLLMFVGGCAGSTGGGVKVIRVILFMKIVLLEIERVFRPRVVRTLEIGGKVLDENVRRSVTAYIGIILLIFLVSTLFLLVLQNDFCVDTNHHIDLETAFSAVAATLNNIGPGLNMVGATGNYAFFSMPAKALLTFLMILGRLEVMVILCLFLPSFWRKE